MVLALCKSILKNVKTFDDEAHITSVSRRDTDVGGGGILVRLATNAASPGMLESLRASWPLASVSMVKNPVDGRTEAQVLLPSDDDQREMAKTLAQRSAWQKPLRTLANVLIAVLATMCAQRVVKISSDQSA
jgi:hypothetical protein